MRLLIAQQDAFLAESQEVLRTALRTTPGISVDNTGAHYAGRYGYCTHIGGDESA